MFEKSKQKGNEGGGVWGVRKSISVSELIDKQARLSYYTRRVLDQCSLFVDGFSTLKTISISHRSCVRGFLQPYRHSAWKNFLSEFRAENLAYFFIQIF